MIWHPLAVLPLTFFWPLLIITLLVLLIFQFIDKPLRTKAAPNGIVSYELAGDVAKAGEIIASWDQRARIYAGFSLGFDFLFMPLYASTISLACLWAASARPEWAWLGGLLAWGVCLAALFDAIENYALWRMLAGAVDMPWPRLARWCAIPKFLLIGLSLLYAAGVAISGLFA